MVALPHQTVLGMIATDIMDCIVVIPTYNERESIAELILRVLQEPRCRVLVVDDNSPDGTASVVHELTLREPRVSLISRPSKLGLGTAYITGFRWALAQNATFICEMDADFSHDPCYLPALLRAAETEFGLVIGSRYIDGGGTVNWGVLRQLVSRGGNLYVRLMLGLPVADATGGYRCYRREVLEQNSVKLSLGRCAG